MFLSVIENILSDQKLSQVRKLIESAKFVHGRVSGGTGHSKNNLEMAADDERYLDVLQIVEITVRENTEFNYTAFPRYLTHPIISSYEAGAFYKHHVDNPVMNFMSSRGLSPLGANYVRSDLSMTLFLTPPDEYEGGELCFDSPTGPVRTKLAAGSAVLYPTGVRHEVAEVRSGRRLAAIFWVQTLFPVEAQRRAVYDAYRLAKMLSANPNTPEAMLAEESYRNLFRLLAAV